MLFDRESRHNMLANAKPLDIQIEDYNLFSFPLLLLEFKGEVAIIREHVNSSFGGGGLRSPVALCTLSHAYL